MNRYVLLLDCPVLSTHLSYFKQTEASISKIWSFEQLDFRHAS